MSLSEAEKERILRALEEDRRFRYAVMGLLGYREVLDRITRLEESFRRLEERQQRLEERQQRLEERQQRLEERQQKLEERQQRLEERLIRVEEELRENRRLLIAIAHRYGVITEEAFREAMKYVIEETLKVAKIEKWIYEDKEGFVYGYPAVVEVDLVVKDKEHILVEVKSRVAKGDVAELHRIGRLYERVVGIKPKTLIIGGLIDPNAWEAARRLNVEIRPIAKM